MKFVDENKNRNHILLMRSRRPTYQQFSRRCVLHFDGRETKGSKKNVLIEYRSRLDNKIRVVLQHGAHSARDGGGQCQTGGKLYCLDFAYPFTPIQAFSLALGLYNFKIK